MKHRQKVVEVVIEAIFTTVVLRDAIDGATVPRKVAKEALIRNVRRSSLFSEREPTKPSLSSL